MPIRGWGLALQPRHLATPDGRKLAYSKGRSRGQRLACAYSGQSRHPLDGCRATPLPYATITNLEILPDREHLLVDSNRGGMQNIWSLPIQGNESAAESRANEFRISLHAYRPMESRSASLCDYIEVENAKSGRCLRTAGPHFP